ncbi:hypothetical protein [Hufsiella ginkgonis]|uniref:Uncharacterized protein n=1 Tax=Hufsiella ginkgonis TaxID=2695274 RepID=A0A7K1XTJ1_9SPHI|nr:hypothetical protein [Hufsiella ginkgonis]MXV14284.1 hypothetical protein [Hufsiella ginkgonis]
MKTLLLLMIVFIHTNCAVVDTTAVYVCESRNATRYHYKRNCRGLGNCTYKVAKITLSNAKKSGKKLCRWED